MTNTPDLTSPDAVERLANRLGGTPLYDGSGEESDLPDNASATLRALSASLEAAEMSAKHWHARAKDAEAERDALKAELAGAVEALNHYQLAAAGYVSVQSARDKADAFLARHQKETDT